MQLPYLSLYRTASLLATPFLPLWLRFRLHKGKEDPLRWREKLGQIAMARPQQPVVWLHASSVGESLSVLPLIKAIAEKAPTARILVTTVTRSSAMLLENKLPDNALHQYIPLDSPLAVQRFLKHWQPKLALFVESELWPNLMTLTKASGCEMRLVNARMSPRSFSRWQKHPAAIIRLLDCFAATYPQNVQSGEFLKKLGAQNLKPLGNLKYDAPPLPADPKLSGEIIAAVGGRARWLAASTHLGEELMAARIHRILREIHEDLLTIIVPRHANRGEAIARDLRGMGLTVARRSTGDSITAKTDIYLADSMGELGVFYRIAEIVFIGGSLVPHGGQNPLEAARLDCAILFGVHMDNFPAITADLIRHNACQQVKDEVDLKLAVENLLHNHEQQEKLAEAATQVVEKEGGAMLRIMAEIEPKLMALTA